VAPGQSWGLKCHSSNGDGYQEDPSVEAELVDTSVYAVI
jgi:hypothetical protein